MNRLKTFILLAALTALFVGVGYLIGGPTGMGVAFLLAAGMNLFSYWNADKLVLGMYGAQPVDATHPDPAVRRFAADVADLADRAGLPRPKTYLIDSDQPNAFATGRDPQHAAVAATLGLLRLLAPAEVRGVVAHELAHVKNRDTLTMTVTATIAGAISALANFAFFFGGRDEHGRPTGVVGAVVMAVVAPMAAALVQMAISRAREYEADRVGADIAGDPQALARALERIEAYARGGYAIEGAERHPATAHLFIVNPLAGLGGGDNLFSTHPSTANRVAALLAMTGRGGGGGRWSEAPVGSRTAVPSTNPWG